MTTECEDCDSGNRDGGEGCFDGVWYGFCESEFCGGLCELLGKCDCKCHAD